MMQNIGTKDLRKTNSEPYEQLYVYYLQGRVKTPLHGFGNGFIGNWQEEDDSFLFFLHPSEEVVDTLLSEQPHLMLVDRYSISYEQWHGGAFKAFKTERFHVIPAWEDIIPNDTELPIYLDPGVVFGTGLHPTTMDCLHMMESGMIDDTVHTVLDMGTGAGILALAAARLGAQRVIAVDFNFLASQTAKRNVERNGMENRIPTVCGRAEAFVDIDSDMLIANIHYDVMKRLVESEAFYRKKQFLLSGLLRSQTVDIKRILSVHSADILEERDHDGIWHTIYGRNG